MRYVGIDVGKDFCVQTAIDDNGNKIQTKFPNRKESIESFANEIKGSTAVLEASTYSLPIYYLLLQKQVNVKLAHPMKVRWIAETRIKTDIADSEKLAYLLKAQLIPEAYAPSIESREKRSIIRHRDSLVKMRSAIKNSIHAILAKEWVKEKKTGLFTEKGLEFLKTAELSASGRSELESSLSLLEKLNEEIEKLNCKIRLKVSENSKAMLLTSIPGIAELSALAITSEIDGIERFSSNEKLASYFGLVPSVYQSGDVNRNGHIHKQGSKLIRMLLIQDANAAIKTSPKLLKFYRKIRRKKGHNVAIVAVARKLVKYIYWVLSNNKEFVDESKVKKK